MRASIATLAGLLVLLGALDLACQPAPVSVEPVAPHGRAAAFEADRAWQHLRALTEIGPRVTGTEGSARARAYIVGELAALGIEVEEMAFTPTIDLDVPLPEFVNLLATIPGASPDLFVLAAPYDTRHFESFRFVGANDGGSGPALLLEIARVLVANPLPYTTRIVFLDGEARRRVDEASGGWIARVGSRALARRFRSEGAIPAIRLLVVFNQVADADLRIARDLRSHRIYREEFWKAADRLGRGDAFPQEERFESTVASHLSFIEVGLRWSVALIDTTFGGDEPPGIYANTEDDTIERCSPESLATVGSVALEALETLSRRLVKTDRFSRSPLRDTGESAEGATDDAAGGGGAAEAGDALGPSTAEESDEPASGDAQEPEEPATGEDGEPAAQPPST